MRFIKIFIVSIIIIITSFSVSASWDWVDEQFSVDEQLIVDSEILDEIDVDDIYSSGYYFQQYYGTSLMSATTQSYREKMMSINFYNLTKFNEKLYNIVYDILNNNDSTYNMLVSISSSSNANIIIAKYGSVGSLVTSANSLNRFYYGFSVFQGSQSRTSNFEYYNLFYNFNDEQFSFNTASVSGLNGGLSGVNAFNNGSYIYQLISYSATNTTKRDIYFFGQNYLLSYNSFDELVPYNISSQGSKWSFHTNFNGNTSASGFNVIIIKNNYVLGDVASYLNSYYYTDKIVNTYFNNEPFYVTDLKLTDKYVADTNSIIMAVADFNNNVQVYTSLLDSFSSSISNSMTTFFNVLSSAIPVTLLTILFSFISVAVLIGVLI